MTMPLELRTIPCLKDNYAYLIHNPNTGETTLVDAPEAGPINAVLAENDGMAGGAIAALEAQGLDIPIGGQDGDHAALNRVARGSQTVSVWKDARELGKAAGTIAATLGADAASMVEGAADWTSPSGTEIKSLFLAPVPITAENLSVVTDAGWITVEALCQGVSNGPAPCN
mgnify:CR=1 FL=1